ncbi:hypothetical protein KW798_02330 [Candidatus Parcubacteria bacterium]|nr:hypothetical protein [Candidatus Parcubacteria bacterium]
MNKSTTFWAAIIIGAVLIWAGAAYWSIRQNQPTQAKIVQIKDPVLYPTPTPPPQAQTSTFSDSQFGITFS